MLRNRGQFQRRQEPINRFELRLALGLCLLVLGGSVRAADASGRSSTSGHDCQCGQYCRGASCCCGHKDRAPASASAPRPTREATSSADEVQSCPCIDSAPCHDSGLPTGSSARGQGQEIVLAGLSGKTPPPPGRWLLPADSPKFPPLRPNALDEPPELTAAACLMAMHHDAS
jgi:hypothetical protein